MVKAFLEKPLSEVTYEDVLALLEELIAEGNEEQTRLELKERISGGRKGDSDCEKKSAGKSLARPIAAMANTEGGRVIIGVKDRRHAEGLGAKERILGIKGDPDEWKQRLSSWIRDNVDPVPHPFPEVKAIPVPGTDRHLFIIDVKPSVLSPHQVWGRGFYIRVSSGDTQLSTAALRTLFQRRGQLLRAVRGWIRERIALIERGEGPARDFEKKTLKTDEIDQQGRLYLHVVSLPFFESEQWLELRREHKELVPVLPVFSWDHPSRTRFNADGLIAEYIDSGNRLTDYTQLLREGAVEVASKRVGDRQLASGRLTVSLEYLTESLVRTVPQLIYALNALGVPPPYHVELALRDLNSAFLQWGSFSSDSKPITRDLRFEAHLTPEAVQAIIAPMSGLTHLPEEAREAVSGALKPLLDHMWQAAGVSGYSAPR